MSTADQPSVEVTGDETVSTEGASRDDASSRQGSRSVLRSVGGNALLRMIAVPISAILGIVVTRLIIENYGQASYGQYAMLVGIGALLPFADLGISASIMNAAAGAKDPRDDDNLRLTLISCMRVLTCSASVVVLLAVGLGLAGAWDTLLGDGLTAGSGQTVATLVLAVIGVTLIVSFGTRLLAGLGKYSRMIVLNTMQTPIVLLVLVLLIKFDIGTGNYLAVVAYLATFFIGVVALWVANRMVRPTLRHAFQGALRVRSVRGARVFDTAWPMLIQMIALPIAMQTDRIILSHVSTLDQLTEYSLASQMFTPVVAVVGASGLALWPIFAKARAEGVRSEVSPFRMSALFGLIAVAVVVAISLASGLLSELATGGTIQLSTGLLVGFSILIVLQAVKYPVGMYMTDADGLRYQAVMLVLMVPVNVSISLVLAERLGAVGPIIGSAVSVALFQVLANMLYVRRHLARAAVTHGEPPGP